MSFVFKIIIFFLVFGYANARNVGETEITTEDGIEVFQNEKFYLLKKNVKIISDSFTLYADNVKIKFNENMYDIVELDAKGNVIFDSEAYNTKGSGQSLNFKVKVEEITIYGEKSELITEDIKMFSDGSIKVNNLNGNFYVTGLNSKLVNEDIFIEGEFIDGIFIDNETKKEIIFLNVSDEEISYVKNNDTEMYAKKINFDNNTALIELRDKVTIIRNGEKISGDYGTLDTNKNSYKVKSTNQKKVKAIIQDNEQ